MGQPFQCAVSHVHMINDPMAGHKAREKLNPQQQQILKIWAPTVTNPTLPMVEFSYASF